MKKNLLLSTLYLITNSLFAQTTIDDVQEGTYLQLGTKANSRITFAGQSLGLTGAEFLPTIKLQAKNGLFASLTPSIYTNASIAKKSPIADLDITLGYSFGNDRFSSENSFSHTQVFYGNKFFRSYLSNAFSSENTLSITDNLEASLNGMLLFSKGKKGLNLAPIIECNLMYHIYIDDVLGAEQLDIAPNCSYYYGSDLVSATFAARDTLSTGNKKVSATASNHTLSWVPGITANWQNGHHEVEVGCMLPIVATADAIIVNQYSYKTAVPIFSISYSFYIGYGKKE
jgi:hypothetical protein